MKTYRKIATIQAEQFDGSAEQVKKYSMRDSIFAYVSGDEFTDSRHPMYLLNTLEGPMGVKIGDWIATGIQGEHWAIADDVFKATYVEAD